MDRTIDLDTVGGDDGGWMCSAKDAVALMMFIGGQVYAVVGCLLGF